MADKLTGKQSKFVDAYIICLNGTEAARRAGYSGDDNGLAVQAHENLRNTKIIRAIDARLAVFAMPANEVLIHLTDIARGDIADALNSAGGIDPLEAKRRGKSHLIRRFKTKITTITEKGGDEREILEDEIEMYDRLKALELLAKYHDLVNKVRVEDWRSQAIADIQSGRIGFEALAQAFDESLATELFRTAGIAVSVGESSDGK
jgi:phage terminase small subunit